MRSSFLKVLDALAAELEPLGFERQRQTSLFAKAIHGNWAVLHIQRSSASSASEAKVTANVGATVSSVLRLESRRTSPRSFADLHWWVRLGELTPDGQDRWWWIDISSLPRAADDFADALVQYGVPHAEEYADVGVLTARLSSGPIPFVEEFDRLRVLATTLYAEGDLIGARVALESLRGVARRSGRWQEVSELAKRVNDGSHTADNR